MKKLLLFVHKYYKINIDSKGMLIIWITYIHVLLNNNKNNFFIDNYNGARFYKVVIDTGPLICELNNYFIKDDIYE